MTSSILIDEVSSHAEMLSCSEVHLADVSSRQLSWKCGGRVRMAQASKVSPAPGGPSEGRLGRQVARRKIVMGARRLVGRRLVRRPSGPPGGPSGGRLGRQEARMQSFSAALLQNVGFAQAAGRAQAANSAPACRVTKSLTRHCRISISTIIYNGISFTYQSCAGASIHKASSNL